MCAVSRRFAALIPHASQRVSEVDWSNDWTCDLARIDVTLGLDGINAYNTLFLAAWVVPLQAALAAPRLQAPEATTVRRS